MSKLKDVLLEKEEIKEESYSWNPSDGAQKRDVAEVNARLTKVENWMSHFISYTLERTIQAEIKKALELYKKTEEKESRDKESQRKRMEGSWTGPRRG
jgi:hypothetical protein